MCGRHEGRSQRLRAQSTPPGQCASTAIWPHAGPTFFLLLPHDYLQRAQCQSTIDGTLPSTCRMRCSPCEPTCLHCCEQVLLQRVTPAAQPGGPPEAGSHLCKRAPNGLTVLHAAALVNTRAAVASALLAGACPTAELDGSQSTFHLHMLLDACGIELTDGKKPSRFYSRLRGATALETAVALGHVEALAALLAFGAAVRRPRAFSSLLEHCPAAARDRVASLLVASQVCHQHCMNPWLPVPVPTISQLCVLVEASARILATCYPTHLLSVGPPISPCCRPAPLPWCPTGQPATGQP